MNKFTRFTALPNDPYVPFKRRKRPAPDHWVAPEHFRFAKHMERAFLVDDKGNKMLHLGKQLVQDRRPEIMQPKRTPIFLGVDAGA